MLTFDKDNLPIPTYLKDFFVPIGNENDEYEAAGTIQCSCMADKFNILFSNDRELAKLICPKCNREILLIDTGKYGWNGFVCGDDFIDREAPLEKYVCPQCEKDTFGITVRIFSQGKKDFEEECAANDDSFSAEDWVNGFEGINVSVECETCFNKESDWADFETM